MITLTCDQCGKPPDASGVLYQVQPVIPETTLPLHSGGRGVFLHYDCIIPWREKDK